MNKKEQTPNKDINSAFVKAGPYLNIGYFFIGAFILFGYAGYKIDQYNNFKFIFLLSGLFLALALGFYNMFKVLSQLEKRKK